MPQSLLSTHPFIPHPQKYLSKLLHLNHTHLFNFQTSHIMVLYFIIQGMTVSGRKIDEQTKNNIIKYIKSLELINGGYCSSSLYTSVGGDKSNLKQNFTQSKYILPHIVFTYSAVNILKIFGSLSQVNQQKCLQSVFKCQKENGSFSNFQNSNQADLRFVYAAVVIWKILKENQKKYIQKCRNYDGGYGLRPYCQSHCGAVYCAVASMKILGVKLTHRQQEQTLQFLVNRQTVNDQPQPQQTPQTFPSSPQTHTPTVPQLTGLQGRVGKLPDSCYTFWIGASLKILTQQNLLHQSIQNFLQLCYHEQSCSFSKYPNMKGDPLHTLHSMVGLMMLRGEDGRVCLVQGNSEIIEK